ncbi:MAG: response regulator, partial [Cyanobacteria bacterium]|nr:response regulator [Cyanobacteriota bacterium]
MSFERPNDNILVVDDDSCFRDLLTQILQPIGYNVMEARSAKSALSVINSRPYALIIVDYRLPDMDGISLITRLRDLGKKTPIVFASGTFCDAKTFNWLRNILQVSLILQKPIRPQLFLQQIEGIIPVLVKPEAEDEAAANDATEQEEYDRLLHASAGIEGSEDESVEPKSESVETASAETVVAEQRLDGGQEMRLQLKQMRKKQEVEERIRHAQRELRKAMPPKWEALSASLAQLQGDSEDAAAMEESVSLAHQLKGTAGSLGLNGVSNAAGKIEDYLKMLNPHEPTEHEILWAEIFRCLVDGESD